LVFDDIEFCVNIIMTACEVQKANDICERQNRSKYDTNRSHNSKFRSLFLFFMIVNKKGSESRNLLMGIVKQRIVPPTDP
jgi:hypothetical protein